MSQTTFNWKIVGAAGEGIKSTGMMFSKTMVRHGLHTVDYTEYPSLIRGGHNTYQVLTSGQKIYSPQLPLDLFITLNLEGLKLHGSELTSSSVTLYDGEDMHLATPPDNLSGQIISVPFFSLAKSVGGERVMANNVALGVSLALINQDLNILNGVIHDTFQGKPESVASLNLAAAAKGYEYAKAHLQLLSHIQLEPSNQPDKYTLTGNEALSLGLLAGGLKAYIAYPMTPSSSILHSLADWQKKANLLVKHAEDEIGVINMALGLSYSGIRAAVGTSGGGFCYMTEAVGLAGVSELPLVIVEAQRPGPALGMPTWTAQADLLFTINASQDEFPRIVLTPGDMNEAFDLGRLSLSLAEDYQLPVIILMDKHVSEGSLSCNLNAGPYSQKATSLNVNPTADANGFYPRYQPGSDSSGISLRTIPGIPNGFYCANSYEHDVYGLAAEDAPTRIMQMDKRLAKLNAISQHIPTQSYFGSDTPDLILIGWGSTKTALQAAVSELNSKGLKIAGSSLSWVWPFPKDHLTSLMQKCPNLCVVEGNHDGQLQKLILQETGIKIESRLNKYDGRPFFPHEIVDFVKKSLSINHQS